MFRSAVVAGGALPVLIEEAQGGADVQRKYLAATALHALALDDPTTDLDNFHSVEICQHGAVEALVKLLGSEHEQLQVAATGALSQLAENPVCQQMISAAGALEPLSKMATFGSDYHKLGALNALRPRSTTRRRTTSQGAEHGQGARRAGDDGHLAAQGGGRLQVERKAPPAARREVARGAGAPSRHHPPTRHRPPRAAIPACRALRRAEDAHPLRPRAPDRDQDDARVGGARRRARRADRTKSERDVTHSVRCGASRSIASTVFSPQHPASL